MSFLHAGIQVKASHINHCLCCNTTSERESILLWVIGSTTNLFLQLAYFFLIFNQNWFSCNLSIVLCHVLKCNLQSICFHKCTEEVCPQIRQRSSNVVISFSIPAPSKYIHLWIADATSCGLSQHSFIISFI